MKNFWLFAYGIYYPNGGMNDLIEKFDTQEEVINFFQEKKESLTFETDEYYDNPLYGMDVAYIYDIVNDAKITLIL